MEGNPVLTCQADRSYDKPPPSCVAVTCDTLTDPSNGQVSVSNNGLFGAVATYECDDGYERDSGSFSRTCQVNGYYDGTPLRHCLPSSERSYEWCRQPKSQSIPSECKLLLQRRI